MLKMFFFFLLVLLIIPCLDLQAAPKKDANTIIVKLAKSRLHHQEVFDKKKYVMGVSDSGSNLIKSYVSVEGKTIFTLYKAPKKSAVDDIFSIYKMHLEGKGFTILCACAKLECGTKWSGKLYKLNPFMKDAGWNNSSPIVHGSASSEHYISAKLSVPEENREIYVTIFISKGWWKYPIYRIDTVEVGMSAPIASKAVKDKVAEATASKDSVLKIISKDEIARGIDKSGRVVIYGIHFDYGKFEMKSDSLAEIQEIAKFLKAVPDQKFYIVGHTDNQGGFESNLLLSRNRSKAVRDELISKHGIDQKQVESRGVGPLMPLVSNYKEDEKEKNTRIEVVEQ